MDSSPASGGRILHGIKEKIMLGKIFFSHEGRLRLSWRLILYVFLMLAVDLAANVILEVLNRPDSPSLAAQLSFAAAAIPGVLGLTVLFRKRLDRRSWDGMALPNPRNRWIDLIMGGFWVLILMPTPLILLALAIGQARLAGTEVADSGWTTAFLYVFAGLINAFVIGFIEELAMRGYVFQNLAEQFPMWIAAAVTGLIFGLLHFWGGLDLAKILQMAAFSAVFVVLRVCTGSLWAAIGLHTAFNWTYTSLLGFSSSEGGYAHALVHVEIPMDSAAATPANPWLGDIGSIVPNLIAFGVVIVILLIWKRLKKQPVDWRVKCNEDGSVIPPNREKNSDIPADLPQSAPAV
jgi:membrane protease YdiL (CAAX protease family)